LKNVLTIAGSDSSGGAGIQADLKTFYAHGIYGLSVITAVTAQNTQTISDVQDVSPSIIGAQIDAIFDDINVDAVKIGMLSNLDSIQVVADRIKKYKPKNIVLDTVMVSKSGYNLLQPNAIEALVRQLIPLATLITPNIPEAELITGITIDDEASANMAIKKLINLGAKNVLLKGGHLSGKPIDRLFDGMETHSFCAERIATKNTHGTGCTLSSAIASNLALGYDLKNACINAKEYITVAIENSIELGSGAGPINHFYKLYKKAGMLNEIEK